MLSVVLGLSLVGCASGGFQGTPQDPASSSASVKVPASVQEALAEDLSAHTVTAPDSSETVELKLDGDKTAASDVVQVDGQIVTITKPGSYHVSGTLTDGQLVVDSKAEGVAWLELDGIDIANSTGSALVVKNVESAVLTLASGSTNTLSDATTYVFPDEKTTEPDAALFSSSDLTITGAGTLKVTGNAGDAIGAKDGLVIEGGTLDVTAADDAIRARDYLVVNGGALNLTAKGDGLKATNDEDAGAGYVYISGGEIKVDAKTDCVQAVSDALVGGGALNLMCGDDGVTSDARLVVDAGTLTIGQSYEGLESEIIVVAGGTLNITSSDDGINASSSQSSTAEQEQPGAYPSASGDVTPTQPGATSAAGGEVSSAQPDVVPTGQPGEVPAGQPSAVPTGQPTAVPTGVPTERTHSRPGGGRPTDLPVGERPADERPTGAWPTDAPTAMPDEGAGRGGGFGGGAGGEGAEEGVALVISGGDLTVNAEGDGIDSNGTGTMTGGKVVVNGPVSMGNGSIDVAGTLDISGGELTASDLSGMAEPPSESASQQWIAAQFETALPAGSEVVVTAADGTGLTTIKLAKEATTVIYSGKEVKSGTTYTMKSDTQSVSVTPNQPLTGSATRHR
jgi:hypothetical protein